MQLQLAKQCDQDTIAWNTMGILSLGAARLSIKGQGVRVRLTYRKEIGAIMEKETVPVNDKK